MKKSAVLAGLVLLNYIVASSAAQASTVYSVSAVPTIAGSIAMIPSAINDHRDVAGYTYMANGDSLAYSYINGKAALVPTLGGTPSSATGINNAGTVVGWSMTSVPGEYRPFLAAPGQTPFNLGTLEGRMSIATGINNSGVISGYSSVGIPYDTGYAAFTTSTGAALSKIDFGRLDVSDAFANGINDSGSVAGTVFSTAAGGWQAFVRDTDGVRILPTLGGNNAQATALNNHGAIIGFSNLATGEGRAFVYDGTNMVDLGALSGSDIFGYGFGTSAYSSALGINDAGTIVGSSGYSGYQGHGFVYTDGKMSDLNNLLASKSTDGWVITDAMAINDAGVIAAYGYRSGAFVGTTLLLTPHEVPEPLDMSLLLVGTFGIAVTRRFGRTSTVGRA